MKFVFKDGINLTETALPVTPASFTVESGMRVETINLHTVGDINLPGLPTLATIKIDALFPAQEYPFANSTQLEPYRLVEQFQRWITGKNILRFIITETPVNIPVLIENIAYGEKDGTGDVYATLTLREYRFTKLPTYYTDSTVQEPSREVETAPEMPENYTIVQGDTLSGICLRFYGDASLYPKLAAVNGIKNPHLIYPGTVLTLPGKANL